MFACSSFPPLPSSSFPFVLFADSLARVLWQCDVITVPVVACSLSVSLSASQIALVETRCQELHNAYFGVQRFTQVSNGFSESPKAFKSKRPPKVPQVFATASHGLEVNERDLLNGSRRPPSRNFCRSRRNDQNRLRIRPRTPPGVHPTQFFTLGPFLAAPGPENGPGRPKPKQNLLLRRRR